MQKILLVLLIAVVVGVGAWAMVKNNKSSTGDNNQQQAQEKPYDPRNPNFIGGKVVSATSSQLNFKVGEINYMAKIDSNTQLIKQAKGAKGVINIVDAAVNDFKTGGNVIVYFDTPLVANVPSAVTKIQLID